MDQFTYAERATDWRGNNNIAESIFEPAGAGAVPGAGRGSSSAPAPAARRATIGRYVRYRAARHPARASSTRRTRRSSPAWRPATRRRSRGRPSRIEGIGRPRVEPSFVPEVVDRMIRVPDAASLAAMRARARAHGPPRRRLHRHQPLGRLRARRRDARRAASAAASSPCSATAATATPTPTTPTTGSPTRASTSRRTAQALEAFFECGSFPAVGRTARPRRSHCGSCRDLRRDLVHPVSSRACAEICSNSSSSSSSRVTYGQPGTTSGNGTPSTDPPHHGAMLAAGALLPTTQTAGAGTTIRRCAGSWPTSGPLPVRSLLFDPDNSLVRQSYSPRMMNTFLNLAGFGMQAWDPDSLRPEDPFTYRVTTLPAFDRNLRSLSSKLAPTCLIAHVRGSRTPTRRSSRTRISTHSGSAAPVSYSRTTGTCASSRACATRSSSTCVRSSCGT